jgi:hypothetical protein
MPVLTPFLRALRRVPVTRSSRHVRGRPRRVQAGNALIFALLGLVVSGIAALGVMQSSRLRAKHDAGAGEASILDAVRNATNAAILEQLVALQAGQSLQKNGIEVKPVPIDGTPTWQPTLVELVQMGYLPAQWTLTRSTLNNAPYTVSFHLSPAGCVNTACDIDGQVLLAGPIRDGSVGGQAASDGAVIGPILTRLGVDAGVSLNAQPSLITGYGHTWGVPNPVAGQPAGVVAVRVGTASSAYSPFVRIGDTRDPNLAGNLTVAGDTVFGATGGAHASTVNGTLQVKDPSGAACVVLNPNGTVDIHCAGRLNAATGVYADGAGHVSTIGPDGVVATGRLSAEDGFATPAVTAFAATDPNAIAVNAGDLFVRNGTGTTLMRVSAVGDVMATAGVQGRQLTLTAPVAEGDACTVGQIATMTGGGLATCQIGKYRALGRFGLLAASCAVSGQEATDSATGEALICKNGAFASMNGLLSSSVLMATQAVVHGSLIDVSTLVPGGCPATGGSNYVYTIYLMPGSDQGSATNTTLNRIATPTTTGWSILLTDGVGASTASTAVAYIYCEYR